MIDNFGRFVTGKARFRSGVGNSITRLRVRDVQCRNRLLNLFAGKSDVTGKRRDIDFARYLREQSIQHSHYDFFEKPAVSGGLETSGRRKKPDSCRAAGLPLES